jgi:type III restriction enzyme
MTLTYKEYQDTAIEQLVKSISDLMPNSAKKKVCVFQSPTGSGKTIMVAKFMEDLIKELPEEDFCFLWVSIGKGELHKQSKKSLDKVFDGFPKVNLLEQEFFGSRTYIEQNEVVVVNWEKIRSKNRSTGEWKNKVMREGETVNFIEVLEKTKEKRKIILIIDESQYASDAQRTNELRDIINADVTLEMSATPKIQPTAQDIAKGTARFVYVDPKDVIVEGMIKKELIINENLGELVDDEKTSQDIIIEAAYNKRLELKEAYKNAGANINPLCLIQLPNAEAGEAKREVIEQFLADKGITEKNGKLAIWLSEDKSDSLDEISDFNSNVEFLLFKQAIDTGWDCPRAHILIKLRDIQSYTFEVQTVGRILRMPQQKHYEDENLNTGYIFTNLQSITVEKEEYNPNIIKHLKATRKKEYKNLKLESYFKSRVDFGDITYSFGKILEKVFCDEFDITINPTLINTAQNAEKIKAKGLTTEITAYKESLITDKNISGEDYDEMLGVLNDSDDRTTEARLADNDLQDTFSQLVKENLNGFAPKRSVPTVRGAIYQWFKKYLGINYHLENGVIHIQYLFLHNKNLAKFSQLLNKATGEYKPIKKEEVKNKIEEIWYEWDIKLDEFYNQHTDEKLDYKLSIYQPCYLNSTRSTPEKEFEKHIESKTDKIEWWFKNGESKKDFFGIKYVENGMPQTFYPDYIINLKSGKIFIGDTKAGSTAKEAGSRAEALHKYILEQNKKGKNLIGGIIINEKVDSSGHWRVNQKETYNYDKNDLTEWEYFDNMI